MKYTEALSSISTPSMEGKGENCRVHPDFELKTQRVYTGTIATIIRYDHNYKIDIIFFATKNI